MSHDLSMGLQSRVSVPRLCILNWDAAYWLHDTFTLELDSRPNVTGNRNMPMDEMTCIKEATIPGVLLRVLPILHLVIGKGQLQCCFA